MTEQKFERVNMQGDAEAAKIQAQWTGVNERVAQGGNDAEQQARQILAREEAKRVQDCQREMQAVLDKYVCVLDVSVILRPGQVIPQVTIVPRQGAA